ncbi:MAG: tRNA (adenosine(37)-N6)-threonylcarbamoyltransferase complex ATPase subunit type 1 TsaE [Nitrospirae bacterium]|nr:MAG: tRNA (adenosine(37)-N6)-threonylcarbamoyltransferase complex ATPase subunit type 1 TsaE [Nitrospirota bacterium]
MGNVLKLLSGSEGETVAIGRKVGKYVKDRKIPVCLYGDLGAGKTTLIKGIGSAFGMSERDIGSASFLIVAEHDTVPPLYHIDLYRIEGGEALHELGIWEYMEGEGVAVVEWAERLGERPSDAVAIFLQSAGSAEREIIIEGLDEKDWNNL